MKPLYHCKIRMKIMGFASARFSHDTMFQCVKCKEIKYYSKERDGGWS